jgi:hypothetical protein
MHTYEASRRCRFISHHGSGVDVYFGSRHKIIKSHMKGRRMEGELDWIEMADVLRRRGYEAECYADERRLDQCDCFMV